MTPPTRMLAAFMIVPPELRPREVLGAVSPVTRGIDDEPREGLLLTQSGHRTGPLVLDAAIATGEASRGHSRPFRACRVVRGCQALHGSEQRAVGQAGSSRLVAHADAAQQLHVGTAAAFTGIRSEGPSRSPRLRVLSAKFMPQPSPALP
jgi:hypothetical protein